MSSHLNGNTSGNRQYPMVVPCRLILQSTSGIQKPPVRLPQDCLAAAAEPLPEAYDFSLEKEVLSRKDERHQLIQTSSSREDIEKNIVQRMRNVTNAKETVCISLLEENNYNLKTSIEAFFQK